MRVRLAVFLCLSITSFAQINNGGGGGASSSTASGVSPFIPYSGNPVLGPSGGESQIFVASMNKIGSTFVGYYSYKTTGVTQVGRFTSSDGKTLTRDTADNPVFTAGSTGTWDAGGIWTPIVWTENGGTSYNMLYTARDASLVGRIGLATSTDGISWTRWAGNNCTGTTGNGCVIDQGIFAGDSSTNGIELSGAIKVGSTYYLPISHFNGIYNSRTTGLATSTDLHTWTKDANNPTFPVNYYDAAIWKSGSYYYMVICHYIGGSTNSDLELYQDTAPTFYSNSRTFLGVVKVDSGSVGNINPSQTSNPWDAYVSDAPWVYGDDITRSTFTTSGGAIWVFDASTTDSSHTNFATGLLISTPATALPTIPNPVTAFPYGITTSTICVGCPWAVNTFNGVRLGPTAFGQTPYQFASYSANTSGASRPVFLGETPLEWWGFGPADTTSTTSVVKLGNVSGLDQNFPTTNNVLFDTSGYIVELTATAALTAGEVVKVDSANASSVVATATTDTGGGIPVGIVQNAPGAAGVAQVVIQGIATTPVLGTGTCSIGNFVIVDTTTAGRVKCTGTYTAGTVIGKAITAQSTVGSAVTVLVQPQ